MSVSLPVALGALPTPLCALIVGGTAGIGLGVVKQLSTLPNAQITIAGRNATVGAQICAEATNKNIFFKRLDASLMNEVKVFCAEFSKELSGPLNTLIMSQGVLSAKWSPTPEGIDVTLALNYYSRMLIIRELIALSALAPNAIVVSVHNARVGDPSGKTILWNDMDLSRIMNTTFGLFSISKILKHNFSMEDIMLQEFSVNSKRTFIHSYPGYVLTNILQNSHFPGWLKWIMSIIGPSSKFVSPEYSGEKILIGAVESWKKTSETGQSWFCINDDDGQETKKVASPEDVMRRVKENTWTLVDKAAETGVKGKLPSS